MTDEVKATLMLQLNSPTGYTADVTCKVSAEQWGAINAIIEGAKTARENALCDEVHTLRELLVDIVDDAGDVYDGLQIVAEEVIDGAAKYLQENP